MALAMAIYIGTNFSALYFIYFEFGSDAKLVIFYRRGRNIFFCDYTTDIIMAHSYKLRAK